MYAIEVPAGKLRAKIESRGFCAYPGNTRLDIDCLAGSSFEMQDAFDVVTSESIRRCGFLVVLIKDNTIRSF